MGRTLHLGRVWSLGPRKLEVGPWGCVSQHWGRCCLELVLVSQELRRGALRVGTQISEDESLSCCYLWGSSVRLIWPWEFQNQIQTKSKPNPNPNKTETQYPTNQPTNQPWRLESIPLPGEEPMLGDTDKIRTDRKKQVSLALLQPSSLFLLFSLGGN